MTLNWKSNESGSLTLDLSLTADDVIEGALAGHQGEQAGRRHEQEEHGAHDGQFCNWEIQKSHSFHAVSLLNLRQMLEVKLKMQRLTLLVLI